MVMFFVFTVIFCAYVALPCPTKILPELLEGETEENVETSEESVTDMLEHTSLKKFLGTIIMTETLIISDFWIMLSTKL